jgi:transposase
MHLSDHSLRQLDEAYLRGLEEEALRGLSVRLLEDLKEAHERLNQTPSNSSRPPSSRAPWEHSSGEEAESSDEVEGREVEEAAGVAEGGDGVETEASAPAAESPTPKGEEGKRRAGKQPGAPGFGRTQVLQTDVDEIHRAEVCAGCGQALSESGPSVCYVKFQSIDLEWGEASALGLRVRVTEHHYHDSACACGHVTRARWGTGRVEDEALAGVKLSEWRLVGPGLASLIVALHVRFHLSRRRTQEFLHEWLGVRLSIGLLDQTIREAGAAVAPLEAELIEAIVASDLLHADETSWLEGARLRWLWVLTTATVTLFAIASRGREVLDRIRPGFGGWLMSDGWTVYRHLPQRLRCWAHLTRKARGLIDSYDPDAQAFGHLVQGAFDTLIAAIHAARDGPTVNLRPQYATLLESLHAACRQRLGHRHAKTRALAVELWNDWEAIFRVLERPEWPLTNNAAERALRHWVIARDISQGTRHEAGSRVFALLASVIDTCRQRGHRPWRYLASVIADRRAGRQAAPLPALLPAPAGGL